MKDINLLPDDIKTTSSIEQKGMPKVSILAIIVTVVVVLVLGVVLAMPTIYLKFLNASITSVNQKINDPKFDEVKAVNKEVLTVNAAINSKNDILKTIDRQSMPIGQIMTLVKQSAPNGVTVGNIDYNSYDLIVSGVAQNSIQVAEYLSNLQRLSFFQSSDYVDKLNIENNSFSFKFSLLSKEKKKTTAKAKDGE